MWRTGDKAGQPVGKRTAMAGHWLIFLSLSPFRLFSWRWARVADGLPDGFQRLLRVVWTNNQSAERRRGNKKKRKRWTNGRSPSPPFCSRPCVHGDRTRSNVDFYEVEISIDGTKRWRRRRRRRRRTRFQMFQAPSSLGMQLIIRGIRDGTQKKMVERRQKKGRKKRKRKGWLTHRTPVFDDEEVGRRWARASSGSEPLFLPDLDTHTCKHSARGQKNTRKNPSKSSKTQKYSVKPSKFGGGGGISVSKIKQ